jgi:xanthine dehydrogenase accessory factor
MRVRELLPLIQRLTASGEAVAVALVVATAGSTYRKAGASMLLTAGGRTEGAVSGGCLEADLLVRVRESVLPLGRPERVTYDTTATDEEVWGLNLGCNGVVEVLLAPAPEAVLAAAARELRARRRGGLLWGASGEALGRCWLLTERGVWGEGSDSAALGLPGVAGATTPAGVAHGDPSEATGQSSAPTSSGGLTLPPPELLAQALPHLWTGRHALLHYEGADYFLQVLLPAPRLLLFGAGAEGPPLARGARELGWSVTVIDHRPALLHPERWPAEVERCAVPPDQAVAVADPQSDDFCIIMTHHFERDRLLLGELLARAPRYIGILGPRARTNLLLSGRRLSPDEASRIASPLGLDLGGEGPAAIALSALAELEAVRWGKSGGRLSDRQGPISTDQEVNEHAAHR